ncbi:MAG: leucyl aminopeptidase family protein [Alphaproteobacteria bacterium]
MFISQSDKPQNLHIVAKVGFADWVKQQSTPCQAQLGLALTDIEEGSFAKWTIDDETQALLILDRSVFHAFGNLSTQLKSGDWIIQGNGFDMEQALTAYFMGYYQFTAYKSKSSPISQANIVVDDAALLERLNIKKKAIFLTRDLINEPVNILGPIELAQVAEDIAQEYGAKIKIYKGKALEQEFPAVYAVGKSAPDTARVADIRWHKKDAPKITLVGKGVCFDTGGVDVKPASSMRLMKKDMGGAANVLGLATMIMGLDLNIDLRVIIPMVENNISAKAFRPGDVYKARNGKTIEIGHTDAEGRVILADCLALASEENNDYIIDMATLTGAARVALGAEIVALMGNDNDAIQDIVKKGDALDDYLWQLPLYEGYRRHIRSTIADVTNSAEGAAGMGGAITAGLFLSEFVGEGQKWMHFDLLAWNMNGTRPGHPIGGEAMAIRAILAWLEDL